MNRNLASPRFIVGSEYPWNRKVVGDFDIRYAGKIDCWQSIQGVLDNLDPYSPCISKHVEKILQKQKSCFGLILISPNECIAMTDQVRSYPIYFSSCQGGVFVGTNPRSAPFSFDPSNVDANAIAEYLMCGYVLGEGTLQNSVSCLLAGHTLWVENTSTAPVTRRYFRYLPTVENTLSVEDMTIYFGEVLDKIFKKAIDQLGDRTVWVPLSGGLDSRLVLCKLVEHKYKNIRAFSYGVHNNHEIRKAKDIASHLNVSWHGLPSKLSDLKQLYSANIRQEYARYADGLHAVPTYLDFEAIYRLRETKLATEEDVIINGYSGDFLFGGHIPEGLAEKPNLDNLISHVVDKHCSHFRGEVANEMERIVYKSVERSLRSEEIGDENDKMMCAYYESWDWQERQSKAVVNGQRLYEFFELDWLLPLWDKDLVLFWSNVPQAQRIRQTLHVRYLKNYNFKGVYDQLRSVNELWTTPWLWVPWIGQLVECIGGRSRKQVFYENMFYFGYFRNQLGMFGYEMYKQYYKNIRRPRVVPLAGLDHLKEIGINIPFGLRDQ